MKIPTVFLVAILVIAVGSQHMAKKSTADHKRSKRAVPAFLVAAAKEIGGKVVSKLGDRIANGVVENHQEKVVSGLQSYLGKQMDKFDDEYKDLLKDTSGLAAGLNRPVEEADIQLVNGRGAMMGNMYAPPSWEIRHKYKYKDDSDGDKDSSGGEATAFTYPAGLGPVLMNGCFGTGYKNGDPCYEAKIPRTGCPNLIDGATYLGVGFDGRGVYSAESRKKSVIQRSCQNLQTYGKNEVPDSMTVQGIYDTDVESYTFSSTEEYRQYLAEKSAVTSARAMFQEEINKASGYAGGGGPFGLIASGGRGYSSQSGTSSQLSGFSASSSASGQLSEKQTQTFMAMLEINIFRYEIFMDDVTPGQLNVGFLRDFISLPESYFSSGAELIFQNFYLRWGTHYIKSAKFGGQLKIIKTKQATQDLSMSEFATRAEADWKMTLSTFSAQASQTKSSSWFHDQDSKTESKQSSGQAASGSESQANRQEEKQASAQEYSNEVLVVQGGDQQIAAVITEMYTTALTTELKDWLESIDDYPKPFSFVLRLVSDLLNIPFDSLFPAGEIDYGCLGSKNLKIEKETGRKYYIQETAEPGDGDKGTKNGTETVDVSEIRYCNFENRKTLEDSMTKRRMALQRAVTVYLEEGRLLSSDFLLPAGEAGCETAMLAFLQGDNTGVPTWEDMIGGKEFTVVFDMPYDILGILQAQDVVTLKFFRYKWFSSRKGFVPHLYDGYKNGKSNDVKEKKVSVQGLVMTYNEGTGVFTVKDDDFKESALLLKDLPDWVNGRDVARAEYKKLLNHLSEKIDTVGDVPCSIHWSNAHRFDPTDGGKCIHFTAASEGDIFVVFASIPQNHETWIYIQISPEGVALYKAMRLQTTQLNDNAGGLGSATLYQSYFVCVTEDVDKKTTAVQYGKTPDNEERPHVWLSFKFNELASLRYYSFGSGESPVKVMGLSLLDKPAKDFIICREGTEMVDGVCQQKCHPECEGCRTSGSDSPTDCIACKHLKMSYPYRPREEQVGAFECVAECPQHMESDTATKSCTCIKKMEKPRSDGTVDCVTDCPLTHFDDNNVCKQCSSFCKDVSNKGKRLCSGPASRDCDTCKYLHNGRCVKGCRPGQKAVKGNNNAFTCRQCEPGHACRLGDEREDICPAGTFSNDDRSMCVPCAVGEFSSTPGATSCQKCAAGTFSSEPGYRRCVTCPRGTSSLPGSSSCKECDRDCAHTCTSLEPGAACTCLSGYQMEDGGYHCKDIDECADDSTNECDYGCVNDEGSFYCTCPEGYQIDQLDRKTCRPINCTGLFHPTHGRVTAVGSNTDCTTRDVVRGTRCRYTCTDGYEPVDPDSRGVVGGDIVRECRTAGSWSEERIECSPMECPLLTLPDHGLVHPRSCREQAQFGQQCTVSCGTNYRLRGEAVTTCTNVGSTGNIIIDWSNKEWTCVQDFSEPYVTCPRDVNTELGPGESHVVVNLTSPQSNYETTIDGDYVLGKNTFTIGETNVVFTAHGHNGETASCTLRVRVYDSERPTVKFCPASQVIETASSEPVSVTWDDPQFVDNVGIKSTTHVVKPNKPFTWGFYYVKYTAEDEHGNFAECTFTIHVKKKECKELVPPKNGDLSCDNWARGKFCQLSCDSGFQPFEEDAADVYTYACGQDGEWKPTSKVPDCVEVSEQVTRGRGKSCRPGAVTKQKRGKTICVSCPSGTFWKDTTGGPKCVDCPVGTYQTETGQTVCNDCPDKTNTTEVGGKREEDCHDSCPPGTFSDTGLGPDCMPCRRGFYQPLAGQTSCLWCPKNTNTTRKGTVSEEDCVGTFAARSKRSIM
ncbi:uncharacterized protein LOC144924689 isoform X2 [Branchiostoma floridae x Branchiostoma belcheri]